MEEKDEIMLEDDSVDESEEEIVEIEENDSDDPDESEKKSADADDDFEYDEEGNIIIPEDEEESEESEEDEETTSDEDEASESETEEEESDAEKDEPTPDKKDTEIAALRKKLNALEAQAKETLSKLGVKNEDVLEGLVSIAAETDGKSTEEYLKEKSEKERSAAAEQLLRATEFEKKARADLAELKQHYPETKNLKDIRDMSPDVLQKFGKYRDMGLSVKEAYAAANPDGIRQTVAESVKTQTLNGTKEHLRSSVPKGSKDTSVRMTRSELNSWRDIFPGKSDKEIAKLYREANKK